MQLVPQFCCVIARQVTLETKRCPRFFPTLPAPLPRARVRFLEATKLYIHRPSTAHAWASIAKLFRNSRNSRVPLLYAGAGPEKAV